MCVPFSSLNAHSIPVWQVPEAIMKGCLPVLWVIFFSFKHVVKGCTSLSPSELCMAHDMFRTMELQWKLHKSQEKLAMLLPAAMTTVDVHVKMVASHQSGVLTDKEQLTHGTG